MAFGITPHFTQKINITDSTEARNLVAAIQTAEQLEWKISYISKSGFIANTGFSMSSWSEQITFKVEGQDFTIKSECAGSQLFDWGKNKRNVEDFKTAFSQHYDSLSQEVVDNKYNEIVSQTTSEQDQLTLPPPTSREKVQSFFSLFIPVEGYFITPILINLNILIFVAMIISGVHFMEPTLESLLLWGGNFRPSTLNGEPWRVLTACFIHIGVVHLLFNMYALVYIGLLLEPRLGKTRFLAAYLLAGIAGSVASVAWNELTVSAGASGAIFGMYGVFLAMLTTNLIEKSARQTFLTSTVIFVGYNLLGGLRGGIDNAAHIGGLISGLLIGYAFYPSLSKPQSVNLKYLSISVMTFLIFGGSAFVFANTSSAVGEYQKAMERFTELEAKALTVYNLPEETTSLTLLAEIDRGKAFWKDCVAEVEASNKLDIPSSLLDKNKLLLEYCNLRIQSYDLLYKSIQENTNSYDSQLQELYGQIEKKLEELGAAS